MTDELDALWTRSFWDDLVAQLPEWDEQIKAFNRDTGALDRIRTQHTGRSRPEVGGSQ